MKKRLFMKRVEIRAFKISGWQVLLSKVEYPPERFPVKSFIGYFN